MRYDIQNRDATERLRTFLDLKGQITPELDSILSGVVSLQDLSSLQGRGIPGGTSALATATAAQVCGVFLFNDPAVYGARLIWLEHLRIATNSAAGAAAATYSLTVSQGTPPAPAVQSGNGLSRDQRQRPTFPIVAALTLAGTPFSQAGGAFPAGASFWSTSRTIGAGVDEMDAGAEEIGFLLPPGFALRVTVPLPALGDTLRVTWAWREVAVDSSPEVP